MESLLKTTLELRKEVEGQVASPGCVQGPARVVYRSEDMIAFKEGEVLVAQYADPSWTPVLSMAAGLVLEVGGFLSHGSIVAREYGIPAVINVLHATEIIKTGDILTVDTVHEKVHIEPRRSQRKRTG
jgi:pyruvate,water dikinase